MMSLHAFWKTSNIIFQNNFFYVYTWGCLRLWVEKCLLGACQETGHFQALVMLANGQLTAVTDMKLPQQRDL